MTERNLCAEKGCPAACCRNIHGQVAGRREFFLKAFPGATKVESQDDLMRKIKDQNFGVYYFEDRGWINFAVSGDCPNLNGDMSCRIHNQRYYPKMCINMLVDSIKCQSAQRVYAINLEVLQSR